MRFVGLTTSEVEEKTRQGYVNDFSSGKSKSVFRIILKNTLTIFNFVNLILALMIIFVGSYKNLLFIFIAIFNTLISIINEIRAKRTIDKMRLVSEQNPTVIRDGKIRQIEQNKIVSGDLLVYSLGDQIIVDSKIVQGTVEVNEAFITGEQESIVKHEGEKLLSGSFIVSGACKAVAVAVGKNNFINKLGKEAHAIKTADSKLFLIMNNIVKYVSFALIPIGILLLWARFRVPGTTTEVAVTSTVAALINMIPEGLILLTSSVLALATIRLSRKKVLVEDLYAIETLARVDCLAIDKTGTLTTGKMTVKDIVLPDGTVTSDFRPDTQAKKSLLRALGAILGHVPVDNATSSALAKTFLKKASSEPTDEKYEVITFSSERKYSGVKNQKVEYLMGAASFLTSDKEILSLANEFKGSYRLITVVKIDGEKTSLLGFVRLEDEIRSTAKNFVQYFYDNDITPKIISGDDLVTVTGIAESVGIKDLRGFDLSSEKNHDYKKLVDEYAIFARVTPVEKKELIFALKKQGYTVAMTGDGVNDILAMKEADVSIAIGEGADAARRVAKMVLLNSDFSSVPDIINEGRQSINNLERSTTLFLSKTVYASVLAILFTILPLEYPYSPIEMSLLNFACIGLPGLVLALEHNTERIKNQFVKNIKQYSVPIGITISVMMVALAIVAKMNNFSRPELLTASLIITFTIDMMLIYWISKPLNVLRSVLMVVIFIIVGTVIIVPVFRSILEIDVLPLNNFLITLGILIVGIVLVSVLKYCFKPKLK